MKKQLLYLSYLSMFVFLPQPTRADNETTFNNVSGKITWNIGNEPSANIEADIADGISSTSVNTGSGLTVSSAIFFDKTMTKYRPLVSNAGNVESVMIEYCVKPKTGIKFKPTNVSFDAVKVGTDGATFSYSYTTDGTENTIIDVDKATILRNNSANAATATLNHSVDITSNETNVFTFRIYISNTNNAKDIAIANIVISGIINGTMKDVNSYSISAKANPTEGGSAEIYPKGDKFDEGTAMTMTAVRNFGYKFVNWTDGDGNVLSTEPKFDYTVNTAKIFTANYQKINTYALNYSVNGGAAYYMVQLNPKPTVINNKNMYEEKTEVILTASDNDIFKFSNWNDNQTSAENKLTMNEDKTISVNYSAIDFIAAWDFYKNGNNGRKADFASADNDADQLVLRDVNANSVSWLDKSIVSANGYEGKAAAVNWHNDAALGTYYWQVKVNATAFTDIKVKASMMYNYNAYKKYNVDYSIDGNTWTNFGEFSMDGAKNWNDSIFNLPTTANNQPELYIRWIADKTSDIDGTESTNDGNAISGIYILGTTKIIDDGNAPKLMSSIPVEGAKNASANGRIVLTFDEKVKTSDNISATLGNRTITPYVSGKTITFDYSGLAYATAYTFTLPANSVSDLSGNTISEVIKINFTTKNRDIIAKTMYDFIVPDNGNIKDAITAAGKRSDTSKRFRIFVKAGEHTFPASETTTVNGSDNVAYADPAIYINTPNVSIIGESMASTILTNTVPTNLVNGTYGPANPIEGIGKGDVVKLQGGAINTYFEDITLKSGMADATGRNIVLNDGGNKTICKNITLYAYQDTYVSNNQNGRFYFEDGVIRGRTDYICGKGDVYFNNVNFKNCDKGGYIAVPSQPKKYGYILNNCTISGENDDIDGNYTLGRPWGAGTPIALWINTRMEIIPSAIGWNEMSGGYPARFAEFNSQTATGTVINLSNRKIIFANTHTNNPILKAEEAAKYTIENIMGQDDDWDPTSATEQAATPSNVKITGNTITWDDNNYVLLWAIVKNDKITDFTTTATYDITDTQASYAIRAANEMGGLGEAVKVDTSTEIKDISTTNVAKVKYYSPNGTCNTQPQKGMNIIMQTYSDGRTKSNKIMLK